MRLLRLGEHRIAKYVAPKERAAEPAVPHFANSAGEITREVLLTQIRDSILDSADLKVTYSKPSNGGQQEARDPGRKRGPDKSGR